MQVGGQVGRRGRRRGHGPSSVRTARQHPGPGRRIRVGHGDVGLWPRSASGGRGRPVACRDAVRDRPEPGCLGIGDGPRGRRAPRRRGHRRRRHAPRRPGRDGPGGPAGDRDGRAPGRAGRHRHRQVAGLPRAGDPARGGQRGTTVVVSTATIALQRQLVDRDLPRLAKALEAAARAGADVRDPQGPPQLPVPEQAARRRRRRRRRPTSCSTRSRSPRMGRDGQAHPRVGRRHRDRRPRRAGARRARAGLAAGVGHRPRVPGRGALPGRRRLLRREGPGRGRAGRRRRHQPRAARHRRARGPSGAARARRGGRRRGARAGRPGHRRGHRRADRRRRSRAAARRLRQARRPGRRRPARRGGRGPGAGAGGPARRAAGRRCPRPRPGVLSAVRDAAACVQAVARRRAPGGPGGRGRPQGRAGRAGRGGRHRGPRCSTRSTSRTPARRRDVVWLAEQGPDGARRRVLRAAPLCGRRAAAGAAVRAHARWS